MKRIFTLVFALFLIGSFQQLKAQDAQFSQFYRAPLQLNPAMTGVFEGSWRIVANYREQYNSILNANPFRTIATSFDMRRKAVRNDYFSFGVNLLQDQAGASLFSQYRGNLSFSYMKQLSGSRYSTQSSYLIIGGQVGAGQNRFNPEKLWFSAQYDAPSVSVNQNADNQEPNLNTSSNIFLDYNAGLMWYTRLDEYSSIYFGGALNHISQAEISLFEDGSESLYQRWVLHGGGELAINRELSILPAVLVMIQGPSLQTNVGANFRYSNHDWREVAIRVGAWGRVAKTTTSSHFDALIFSTILEMERWNVGLSYDINTSNLRDASQSRGAFEVSLIYVHPAKEKFKVNCPKF